MFKANQKVGRSANHRPVWAARNWKGKKRKGEVSTRLQNWVNVVKNCNPTKAVGDVGGASFEDCPKEKPYGRRGGAWRFSPGRGTLTKKIKPSGREPCPEAAMMLRPEINFICGQKRTAVSQRGVFEEGEGGEILLWFKFGRSTTSFNKKQHAGGDGEKTERGHSKPKKYHLALKKGEGRKKLVQVYTMSAKRIYRF